MFFNIPGIRSFFASVVLIGLASIWQHTTPTVVLAQADFDAVEYFQKLDTNGDRWLAKEELNPRALRYLEKSGLRATDGIRLRDIERTMEKARRQDDRAAKQAAEQQAALPVPGFGPPDNADASDSIGPASFGNGEASSKPIEYSEKTLQMIDYTLRRYDRDRDGAIDSREMRRGNWGRPAPEESDTNGDGILSRDELAMRYHVREQQQKQQRTSSNSKANPNANQRQSQSSNQSTERSGQRSSRRSESSERDQASASKSQPSTRQRSSSLSERDKYVAYSRSLINRYDADKDGQLNEEEWKAVRRRPAGADQNGDGFVTMDECTDALMGAKSGSNGSRSSSTSPSGSGSAASGRASANAPMSGDMNRLDSDGNAQIEMHEFSGDWNEKKLKEFYAIDRNGDGVITPQEWSDR